MIRGCSEQTVRRYCPIRSPCDENDAFWRILESWSGVSIGVWGQGGGSCCMTPEELEWMHELVLLIEKENDRAKFINLVTELNELLSRKNRRLAADDHAKGSFAT